MMMAKTYISPEDHAYNTYSGTHTGSGRKGKVLWPDGRIRTVTLGVADTYFTIPAHGRYRGRYVSGYVTTADWADEERGSYAEIPFPGIEEGDAIFVPSARYRALFGIK